MITEFHVKNFKCLDDVSVRLGAFNVFIGPNDSGKTSLLQAMQVAATLRIDMEAPASLAQSGAYRSRLSPDNPVNLEVRVGSANGSATLRAEFTRRSKNGTFLFSSGDSSLIAGDSGTLVATVRGTTGTTKHQIHGFHPAVQIASALSTKSIPEDLRGPAHEFGRAMSGFGTFRLEPRALRSSNQIGPNPKLSSGGENLAAVLDALQSGPKRKLFDKLETDFANAVPSLSRIALYTPQDKPGHKAIELVLAGTENDPEPKTVKAEDVSDGAMLALGYLALAYTATPAVLMIEEPENGLHPELLRFVVDLLRKMSRGELGGAPRQIILTTHSPLLLNYVEPEEVHMFFREAGGPTTVKRMSELPEVARMRKEFSVGEIWYLLGEKKLLESQAGAAT